MDTEKQRQRRRDGTRLSESRNTRSKLLGELLSGPECRRPVWFLDMKYQTCFTICQLCHAHARQCIKPSPLVHPASSKKAAWAGGPGNETKVAL